MVPSKSIQIPANGKTVDHIIVIVADVVRPAAGFRQPNRIVELCAGRGTAFAACARAGRPVARYGCNCSSHRELAYALVAVVRERDHRARAVYGNSIGLRHLRAGGCTAISQDRKSTRLNSS